ncbi:MAG: DUF4253 domain-containing protein [Microthrixaceae bacterium]|jgi:hypothetical protein|nr:DUF4253 domain-containing protein [Microthrixaceae bacterium]
MSANPTASEVPAGLEPWCKTLRGEQAWRMEIPGGEAALARWRALRDQHSVTGMWPVILGSDLSIIDQMTWRVSILAEDSPGIPDVTAVETAPELFVKWLGDPKHDDYLGDVPRHLAKLEADQATIRARLESRPDHAAVRAVKDARVHLGLVPARGGWELPALLAWSAGEGLDIGGPEHLSVLHFWYEAYGAEVVAMGLEQLECLVTQPPDDARGAFELAVQHYAYCPALMDNLAPAMGALAATLFGRHWFFDWS